MRGAWRAGFAPAAKGGLQSSLMRMLIALLLFAHAAGAQTVWRGATEYPATAMPGEGLTIFARELAVRSGGALRLEPRFDAPDGLRSADIPGAVQSGQIEVGDAFAGALAGVDPIFQLSSLPFLATRIEDAWRLYQAAKPAYAAAFASRGQHLAYATPWPATGIWSRGPVTDVPALQGLAVRTYDATSTRVLRDAGAAPVQLSFADALPRLQDGSIVAVLSSGDGGAGRNLWDYTRHFCAIGYAVPLSLTTISAAAYDALTPERRQAVDDAAAATELAQWRALLARTGANYDAMRLNGVAIEQPEASLVAVLAQAGAAVTIEWAGTAGPQAAAALEAYRR